MPPFTIRLGTASPGTKATKKLTIVALQSIINKSSSLGVDILLLPEAYLGGYPRGSAFGCKIGDRSAEGRNEFLEYWKQAIDLGDEGGDSAGVGDKWVKRELGTKDEQRGDGTREVLEGLAAETGVFLVVGCIEKAGGSLYCSVVYVCPKAGMVGKRRKVMPVGARGSC
jgi:nitrilase